MEEENRRKEKWLKREAFTLILHQCVASVL